MAKQITSIEGITELRLDNGTQVLLFPDPSKSMVTVNMTVFVGSRHEGYGEAGMAHLLEHRLFKGTPSHEKIPDLMKSRGADFNGTTWLDRTNYYETLPAATPQQADENLEFAIRLEADRLVNSYVRGEDLISEMTVVRSEFESGENSPSRVLMQRVTAAAYEWHNYGRSTIGNRSDIERVPIDRLQAFYRKFYRPDNIMVVVAGKFDNEKCVALLEKYFGALQPPETPIDRTYTTEPAQDGERTVVLRRVGTTQLIQTMYHVPAGGHRDFAAVELLAYIYGAEPAGRLYKDLVLTELASQSYAYSMGLHDPGLAMFGLEVSKEKSLEDARQALIKSVETVAEKPITAEELSRAKTQFMKDRELRSHDSKEIAIELSEWAAQGDWRLYFLFRDYIESLTAEELTQVASKYFTRNNRTVGLFIPSEKSERIEVPSKPDLKELLAEYKGRGDVEHGEDFDPDPIEVEKRIVRGKLSTGIKTAYLPKKTRGNLVNVQLSLRYGNEETLTPLVTAAEFFPSLLQRGTESLDHEQLQDKLDELRAKLNFGGTTGLLQVSLETKREYLKDILPLIGEILRKPRLDAAELEIMRRQAVTRIQAQLTEPRALAPVAQRRISTPYEPSDIRYVPTLQERIDRYQAVNVEQIRKLHSELLNGENGELVAVGDFDQGELEAAVEKFLVGWKSDVTFQRIASPARTDVAGRTEEIQTPDKENAVYYAGEQIEMRDDDPDYPALIIGNFILGGGSLSSRLGDRVRQQEGLSYGIGSGISSHPIDKRTTLTISAITNPINRDRLAAIILEELEKLQKEGITAEELESAQQGYLQNEQLSRTEDSALAQIISSNIFAGRTMEYEAKFEKRVADLKIAEVNAALKKYIDLKRLIVVTAGDFEKAKAESN
ncbi:MAG: pitrilysin family protein [Pirellulales bacterium]